MESINELKEIDIKNSTYYYFDDIIKFEFNREKIMRKYFGLLHFIQNFD